MAGELGDIAEGAGDIATGGLLARAVDRPGGGEDGHTREAACLNCGAPLAGPHCHQCGQRAHVHRTLSAFFHDLLHGVLHFEGKTWRTLPLLVWQPGKLTREYIDGRRARYVSPIALFLFVVFLTFALFSMLGGSDALSPDVKGAEQVKSAYAAGEAELADLRAERERKLDDPADLAEIDRQIAEVKARQDSLGGIVGAVGTDFEEGFSQGFEENPLPDGNPITSAWKDMTRNPQLTIYKMQTNAYKFSWMLIPLSVPFVWLLFAFNRRFRGYDHTVFTTYSITFMIALVAAASLLGYFGWGGVGFLLLFYAPFHMYRQLRGTYGVGRFGAFWRMLALSLFAWLAIGLFVALLGWMAAGN